MSANVLNEDQFKRNDDEFRNTMESLFQKYSSLNDPGIEVCLKTMTCRTERGPVPIDSAEGERELEALKTRLKDHSVREFVDQNDDDDDQVMDVSGITEDDLNGSDQQNNEILWHGGESFQLSMNLTNSSHSGLWGVPSQPEEADEGLEKTLSSHGSALLDVYPSMLNQIGEAYHRQHVKDTARGVLQKYRRKHWQVSQAHPRNTSFKMRHNGTLNKTTDISFTKKSPAQWNTSCSMKGSIKLHDMFKKSSPALKNSEASGCFYSPRRDAVDESFESPQTNLLLDIKPTHNPVRVIDFTTPPYSVSPLSDQSPDLNQTYNIGPTVLSTSHAVPGSLVSISPRPAWHSPGRPAKALSFVDQSGMSITSQPFYQQPAYSSLDKNDFREHLHSPVSSPKRGFISCFSPSGKSTFRSTLLRNERHQSKPTAIHSPKRRSPIHYLPQSEVHRSLYGGKLEQFSSTQRPLFHNTDQLESFSMSEKLQISPRLNKHQHSLSRSQSTSLSKYDSFREPQIDAEFRKLYHHFICRGTSSPYPTTHCHLCERQLETSQIPSSSSSSMSTLALTPLRDTLKKRRHQPDVEESFRFKRFRESRSPLKHLQLLPHQLKNRYMSSAMSEPSEDKHAWNRAVLLQCPSPWFLRGTGNLRKIREDKLAMQMNPCAMSWRDVTSGVHAVEAHSPIRTFNHGTIPLSPSLSRRRLQDGLQQ